MRNINTYPLVTQREVLRPCGKPPPTPSQQTTSSVLAAGQGHLGTSRMDRAQRWELDLSGIIGPFGAKLIL